LTIALAFGAEAFENGNMEIPGRVHNGVVVFEGSIVPPEGALVTVCYSFSEMSSPNPKRRVEFPLVRSRQPGSLFLTNELIHDLQEEEDLTMLNTHG
jgi:hypothetical protein